MNYQEAKECAPNAVDYTDISDLLQQNKTICLKKVTVTNA